MNHDKFWIYFLYINKFKISCGILEHVRSVQDHEFKEILNFFSPHQCKTKCYVIFIYIFIFNKYKILLRK